VRRSVANNLNEIAEAMFACTTIASASMLDAD